MYIMCRGYKINCNKPHEHFTIYPERQLREKFNQKNIGQIFIRTAPLIAKSFLEQDNYIGIPQLTAKSVENKSLKLTNIQLDGSLDFVVVSTGEDLHLPKEFDDQKWTHTESFLEKIKDNEIVCRQPPNKVDEWSDWTTDYNEDFALFGPFSPKK